MAKAGCTFRTSTECCGGQQQRPFRMVRWNMCLSWGGDPWAAYSTAQGGLLIANAGIGLMALGKAWGNKPLLLTAGEDKPAGKSKPSPIYYANGVEVVDDVVYITDSDAWPPWPPSRRALPGIASLRLFSMYSRAAPEVASWATTRPAKQPVNWPRASGLQMGLLPLLTSHSSLLQKQTVLGCTATGLLVRRRGGTMGVSLQKEGTIAVML
eukprot:jgi/Botrbrau1/9371/Bobra.354_2s0026.1